MVKFWFFLKTKVATPSTNYRWEMGLKLKMAAKMAGEMASGPTGEGTKIIRKKIKKEPGQMAGQAENGVYHPDEDVDAEAVVMSTLYSDLRDKAEKEFVAMSSQYRPVDLTITLKPSGSSLEARPFM